jgi:arylsulfatase A-like enzyme
MKWQVVSLLRSAALAVAACTANPWASQATGPPPPNIVLILADDLGARDLGCYGADLHETPHLDRLARESIQFTQAYAPSPVCTPTRAALLTGKAPARLRMTIWSEGAQSGPTNRFLLEASSQPHLPVTETTLARRLQDAGYQTALVGKWHLGDASHAPEVHGFDVNIGGTHWGAPTTFFYPYRGSGRFGPEFRYVPHLEFGRPGEYLTDRLTDEALRVIDHAAARRQPFFLYLAHYAPHTPIEANAADVDYFTTKLQPAMVHQNPVYAAMIKSLDDSVGRVLTRLRERNLEHKTLVVFASDNGGYLGTDRRQTVPVTSNAPLRSGKGTLYEGGLRVPLLVRPPGAKSPGAQCDEPVMLTDLYPTLAAAAGLALPVDASLDGIDLTSLLANPSGRLDRDALFFHYPHYYHAPPSTPAGAVRAGRWKLIEYFDDQRVELYDLDRDPGEQQDLASEQRDLADALRQRLHDWRRSVDAALPEPNPRYLSDDARRSP